MSSSKKPAETSAGPRDAADWEAETCPAACLENDQLIGKSPSVSLNPNNPTTRFPLPKLVINLQVTCCTVLPHRPLSHTHTFSLLVQVQHVFVKNSNNHHIKWRKCVFEDRKYRYRADSSKK